MALISAGHGKWFARVQGAIVGPGDEFGADVEYDYLPVIAWGSYDVGEEYRAFVLDVESGNLVPACGVTGFAGIADAEEVTLAEMTPEEIRVRNKRERERLERLR
ncbi:hypothetical protein ACWDR5_03760 [Streptomyces koyangensis]